METTIPKMMTIREIARLGVLPEHALRLMLKAGQLPALYVGKKALINYDNYATHFVTWKPLRLWSKLSIILLRP